MKRLDSTATDDERKEIRECRHLVLEVFEVCNSDAARQAIRAGLDAIDAFLERGEMFEADDVDEDQHDHQEEDTHPPEMK